MVKEKRKMGYLFFSAESQDPAGYFICKMLNPIEQRFNEKFTQKYENRELSQITIIFICMEEEWFKERKYISRINRYADFRLKLDYIPFLQADEKKRKQMLWDVIERAFSIIKTRKGYGELAAEVENDLRTVFWG